jgi:hypothetical protein
VKHDMHSGDVRVTRSTKYLVIGTYCETSQTTYDYIVARCPEQAEGIVRRARDTGDLWEPVATYDSNELMESAMQLREMTLAEIRKGWQETKSLL